MCCHATILKKTKLEPGCAVVSIIHAKVEGVEYRNMVVKPSFSDHLMHLTQYGVSLGFSSDVVNCDW